MLRCVDCGKYSECKYADPTMPKCLGFKHPELKECTCGSDDIRAYTALNTMIDTIVWEAQCSKCGRRVTAMNSDQLVKSWNNGDMH